jgi:pimeloyl-ACP methyl ester carboxylesterase
VSEPLVCPSCASTHGLDERFCPRCGMPLVYAGRTGVDQPVTERHERARKVKPQYTEGELVRVAGAQHQAEAELIQGLLLEEGIPSLLRRTRGFDVPDMLAAGPRDVMVPASGAEAARELLLEAEVVPAGGSFGASRAPTPPLRVLAGLLLGIALVALIAWIGTDVLG